ncbi:MAG: M28 family peptidase [Edaphocola sp.]
MICTRLIYVLLCAGLLNTGCRSGASSTEQTDNGSVQTQEGPTIKVPAFDADKTYGYIKQQVDFGPRVPNTSAQLKCADWMELQLKASCDTVYRQQTQLLAGDKKTKLRCINLIGVINPNAKQRILLLAHWDSRPWADQDVANTNAPIDAADDGASGVAVLIGIANQIKANPLGNKDLGIDILLADVEDYGKSEWETNGNTSYALGTQYWAENPHVPNYTARAGILLDMVGGRNARFPLEGNSKQYAGNVQQEVWKAGSEAGYSSYFVYADGGTITDDHVPVLEILHIPTIDIIDLPTGTRTGFPAHWHTHNDNITAIDQSTLKAVGQTLLQYLYNQ